jgi:phospholipase/carboxylesterase
MKMVAARAGSLTCRIVEAEDQAGAPPVELLCVLCHGYGAPGTDLVGLAGEVLASRPRLRGRVRFAFPEAPLALEFLPFGGRAWWHIEIDRFQRAAMTGDIEPLLREVPEGLPAARKALRGAVEELARAAGLPLTRVVLGGFSQGAMVATDVALRLEEAPAALAVMSGTLICRDEWERLVPQRRGLKVLQSHGTGDPILPYAAALELRGLFERAELQVDFISFRGGHGIDGEVIERLAALLEGALP